VVALGLVSLLNDASSEMITPLLPVFLTLTLGAGPTVIGLVEGLAEATASFLKLASGWLADRGWNAKGLVVSGYGLSNGARPLIGLAPGWPLVLALRFLDRVGKGLRTSPRDALIAASVSGERRGRAFGFHRGMDHAGAVLGPLLAFSLLAAGLEMQQVFFVSVLPGALALAVLIFGFREPEQPALPAPAPLRWNRLDARLKGLILTAGALALASVPEAFLVLFALEAGVAKVWIPLLWALAALVKSLLSLPAGMLSDHWGRLPVVAGGWGTRAVVLAAVGLAPLEPVAAWLLFLAYGASLAVTEGAERALIGDFAPPGQKATAFGVYHLVSSGMLLPGAVVFGGLWEWLGMRAAFFAAALLTLGAMTALLAMVRRRGAGR